MSFVRCGLAALCCLLPGWVAAQDTLSVFPGRSLPEWTVEAVRGTANAASAPYALAVETHAPDVLPSAALSMERVLRSLPGVWVNDQGHFALGERISVRGMGARAPFGVRGMQVVLDGIPLTMPDGQTVLDVVESAVLRRTELLRSPAALFWGNGSGAVLFLASEEAAEAPRFPRTGACRFVWAAAGTGRRPRSVRGACPAIVRLEPASGGVSHLVCRRPAPRRGFRPVAHRRCLARTPAGRVGFAGHRASRFPHARTI